MSRVSDRLEHISVTLTRVVELLEEKSLKSATGRAVQSAATSIVAENIYGRLCSKCGAVHSVDSFCPQTAGKCAYCGGVKNST